MNHKDPESDHLELLKKGDHKALRYLYEVAFKKCESLVLKNSGTREDAKDIFQEGIIAFMRNIRKEDFILTCKVDTYLFSIVRNQWLKKISRKEKNLLPLIIDLPDVEFVSLDEREWIEKKREQRAFAISELMEADDFKDCEKILEAYYYKKVKLKDIAKEMGYTYDFIKVKKKRCLDMLKRRAKKLIESTQ